MQNIICVTVAARRLAQKECHKAMSDPSRPRVPGEQAQFWAVEHPSTPGFAERHGIPPGNYRNADYIETATLNEGGEFVVRRAPPPDGLSPHPNAAYEVVVPPGGVRLESVTEL